MRNLNGLNRVVVPNQKSDQLAFTLSSWNTASSPHYSSLQFHQIAPHIDLHGQDILCLQELHLPQVKLERSLLDALHTTAITHCHNAILTKFPVVHAREITALEEHPRGPFESVQVLNLNICGRTVVVYNCHLPIVGVGLAERMTFLQQILADANSHDLPAVICGDLNTTLPIDGWRRRLVKFVHGIPQHSMHHNSQYYEGDERWLALEILSDAGFSEVFPMTQATWAFPRTSMEPLGLKLDWICVRGLTCLDSDVGRYISDHRRLNTTLTFQAN